MLVPPLVGIFVSHAVYTAYRVVRCNGTAAAAFRERLDLAATMSHEIRTPLNAVIGLSELMAETVQGPVQARYCDTILRSSAALVRIVDDILDVAKIDAGGMALECQSFDLRDLLEDLSAIHSPPAAAKEVEMIPEFPPVLTTQRLGDAGRLRQILGNLIGNAVKFTSTGSVRVSAAPAAPEVRGPSRQADIAIRVTDTGPGIDRDALDAVFDPFRHADGSISRDHGGTGMGLSIARKLAELMGGTITVAPTPGQGSVFDLRIDLPASDTVPDAPPRRVALAGFSELQARALARDIDAIGHEVTDPGASGPLFALVDVTGGRDPDAIVPDRPGPTRILVDALPNRRDTREAGSAPTVLARPVPRALLAAALAPEQCGVQSRKPDRRDPGRLPRARIRVAEDNATNRMLVKTMLESENVTLKMAEDGLEAVEAVDNDAFDLILMDMSMPKNGRIERDARDPAARGAGREAADPNLRADSQCAIERP